MIFEFAKEQLLVEYYENPIKEGTDSNDLLEVLITDRGARSTLYNIGETVLVRRGYLEEIKSSHFKKHQKIIFKEDSVMCRKVESK
jgi:hypothetical protein